MGDDHKTLEKSGTSSSISQSGSIASSVTSQASSKASVLSRRLEAADLPEELAWLAGDACNPQINTDPEAQKQGRVRPWKMSRKRSQNSASLKRFATARFNALASLEAAQNAAAETMNSDKWLGQDLHDGRCFRTRRTFGRVVLSAPVQALVLITIIFDCVVTLIDLTTDDDDKSEALSIVIICTDVLVPTVFTVDILARIAFFGCYDYWRKRMNCFEFLILVISLLDIILARFPVFSVLRVLRPIMRLFRVLRLFVRIFERGRSYQTVLRHHVSGGRLRCMEDGFDLDLCYVTDQIIAMSVPATGYAAMFHNPVDEVAQFMNERHPNKYLIINATEDQYYPTLPFFERSIRFPIAHNGVPTVDQLYFFCKLLTQYLEIDPHHVIAVHSKHGQGRVGVVVAALLIYSHKFDTVSAAIAFLEQCRRDPKGNVAQDATAAIDCASQERFLEYFAIRCKLPEGETLPAPRKVMLRKMILYGCPDTRSLDVCCFAHPGCGTSALGGITRSQATNYLHQGIEASQSGKTAGIDLRNTESFSQAVSFNRHLSMPHRVIQSKLQQLREECEFDSRTAGAFAMAGMPLFTSAEKDGVPDKRMKQKKITEGSRRSGEGSNAEAEWNFVDTELSGEIRFEVHRERSEHGHTQMLARGVDTVYKRSGAGAGVAGMKQLMNFLACRRRHNKKAEVKAFGNGMLFCCWVHTSFLEMNEPPQSSLTHSCDESLVHVVLNRFDLDKAMHAPAFRNYTSNLKLHLVFQADRAESIQRRSLGLERNLDEQWQSSISTRSEVTTQGYSLEWLNWLVRHLWPKLHPALGDLLKNSIEPAIQDLLPAPLNNLSFTDFSFTDRFPEFGTIRCSAREQEGFELQLDIQVKLDTPVSVMIHAAGVGVIGINHIKLIGLLSVKLKPINDGLPGVEGVQFMFMNMPELDITFMGNLAGAANLSWVKRVIVDAIQSALLDIMVMPNLVALNYSSAVLEAGDSVCTFQDVLPPAVLRLRVISARDMTTFSGPAEFLCGKRLPDPFATVRMGDQTVQTAVASGSANPSWGEEFDLLFYDEGQYISVIVRDGGFNNAMLGQVRDHPVTAKRFVEAGQEGLWLSLVGPHGEPQGRICIAATVLDLCDDLDFIRKKMDAQDVHAAGRSGLDNKKVGKRMETLPELDAANVTSMPEEVGLQPISVLDEGSETPASFGRLHVDSGNSVASPSAAGDASGLSTDTRNLTGRPFGAAVMDKSAAAVGWCYEATSNTITNAGSAALAGLSASLTSGRSRRGARAIAVLICRVNGGNMPKMMPHLLDVRLRLGSAFSRPRRCMETAHAEMNNVSADLHNVIERLALAGWDQRRIADIVERESELVKKVMRKELGWNLDMPHRLCLPISIEDCGAMPESSQSLPSHGGHGSEPMVEIAVTRGNKMLGSCHVELKSVIDPPLGKVYRGERSLFKDGVKLDSVLDVELSLYSLKQRGNQRTIAKEQTEERITKSSRTDDSKRGIDEGRKSALKKDRRVLSASTTTSVGSAASTSSKRTKFAEAGSEQESGKRSIVLGEESIEMNPSTRMEVSITMPKEEQSVAHDTAPRETEKNLFSI